jgi:hypothetical protein
MHKLTRRAALGALASISATAASGAAIAASPVPEAVDALPAPPAAAPAAARADRAWREFVAAMDEMHQASGGWDLHACARSRFARGPNVAAFAVREEPQQIAGGRTMMVEVHCPVEIGSQS